MDCITEYIKCPTCTDNIRVEVNIDIDVDASSHSSVLEPRPYRTLLPMVPRDTEWYAMRYHGAVVWTNGHLMLLRSDLPFLHTVGNTRDIGLKRHLARLPARAKCPLTPRRANDITVEFCGADRPLYIQRWIYDLVMTLWPTATTWTPPAVTDCSSFGVCRLPSGRAVAFLGFKRSDFHLGGD